MVKNLHFCTNDLLFEIYEGQPGNIIETYRTGFIPSVYPTDIINLNERNSEGNDKFICKGRIEWVLPLQYKELSEFSFHNKGIEELSETYRKEFNPYHWVFNIGILLYPEVCSKSERYYQKVFDERANIYENFKFEKKQDNWHLPCFQDTLSKFMEST